MSGKPRNRWDLAGALDQPRDALSRRDVFMLRATKGYRWTTYCVECERDIHRDPDRSLEMAGFGPTPGKRQDARYCSNACRQRAYRERKKAERREA